MNLLKNIRSGKAGHPKVNKLLRELRVKTWFNVVSQVSGKNAYELEIEFSPEYKKVKDFHKSRSRIWTKYKSGKATPTYIEKDGGRTPVALLVEEKYPETLKWLLSPVWTIANPEANLNMLDLKPFYELLPGYISKHFIEENMALPNFWRKEDINLESILADLAKSSDPNAFIALLCLYQESIICLNAKKI